MKNVHLTIRCLPLLSSIVINDGIINPMSQLETRRVSVEKEISNIKLVVSWIPRKQTMVPEAKIFEQTDPEIILPCKFDEAS